MKAVVIFVGLFISLPAISEEAATTSQEPFVDILGVKISRGMPESKVRAYYPNLYCAEQEPGVAPGMDYCTVSGGKPPKANGDVTFKEGIVHSATRYWHIPVGSEPLDALLMLNGILSRLTGEDTAACAKIETYRGEPTYTVFAFREKVLTVQMHEKYGPRNAYFRESLRVNPVPDSYTSRGKTMQGDQWCAYVN